MSVYFNAYRDGSYDKYVLQLYGTIYVFFLTGIDFTSDKVWVTGSYGSLIDSVHRGN